MSLTRDELRAYTQHRCVINGNVEVQVNGVTETHVIALWPGSHEQLALAIENIDTIEISAYVCSACTSTVEVVHGEDGLCTNCFRDRARSTPFAGQPCDDCGTTDRNVWRDPITRKNEYFCSLCHAKRGRVFLNRWAPRVSEPLGMRDKLECDARNVPGTVACEGSIRPRGGHVLCNAHAGTYRVDGG